MAPGSSPQRSGSLRRRALIGSAAANSILEQQLFEDVTSSRCFAAGIPGKRKKRPRVRRLPAAAFTDACSGSSSGRPAAPPVRLPANLSGGFMVLDSHCNKWIRGGDPTKVSGALLPHLRPLLLRMLGDNGSASPRRLFAWFCRDVCSRATATVETIHLCGLRRRVPPPRSAQIPRLCACAPVNVGWFHRC